MPTTPLRNRLYQMALPLLAPRLPRRTEIRTEGREPIYGQEYAALLRKHHVMGAAALLRAGDEELLMLSDSPRPKHIARKETLFRVASITKMATALCVMRCQEEGLLELDRPVKAYFPGERFAGRTGEMTCRQLLCHRAGLMDPPDLENRLLEKKPVFGVLAETMKREPGAEFHYSNLGFGFLGCVLEAVMDAPVSRIMEEKVFRPLGMNATLDASGLEISRVMPVTRVLPLSPKLLFQPRPEVTVTRLGSVPLTQAEPALHYGHTAGAMYTDIGSLARMMTCLMGDGSPLLKQESVNEMRREHAAYGAASATLKYGLGLLLIEDERLSKGRILGHQGYAYGCADGAFWEEETGNMVLFLNGGCSEAREGRLGLCNLEMLRWSLRREMPAWLK